MGLRLITAPTDFPVTVDEAKDQCRVDGTDNDTYLGGLIATATDHVESYTGRAIMEQTWELVLDDFCDPIQFPKGPVSAITSVKYLDTDGVEQTISDTNYTLDDVNDPQLLVKASDYSWPTVDDGVNNVAIRFVCGYTIVPPAVKHAILLLISHWFDNRGVAAEKAMTDIPHAVDALLCNHRSYSF